MNSIHQVQIQCPDDIINLRKTTRVMLQLMSASLKEQARISWVTDYLARQMLNLGSKGEIILTHKQNQDGRQGIEISCNGKWLRPLGPFYQMHLIPVISKSDEVVFTDSDNPHLKIVSWVS